MGCCPILSRYSKSKIVNPQVNPVRYSKNINPDPLNFKIERFHQTKSENLAVYINYPDCTNFEGNKILVFKNRKIKDIINSRSVDPHFSDEDDHNLIARFIPTEWGWRKAIEFVHKIGSDDE